MCRTHSPRKRALAGLTGFLILCGLVATHTPVGATSVILQGTTNLLDNANSVVTGTVVSVEARVRPEHKFIYRYVTVEVSEVLKGTSVAPGQRIVLEELGGTVDKQTVTVPGVPQFEVGERVLTFLEDRPDGFYRTWGMIQGKFAFETDPAIGREILTRPAEWTDTYLASNGEATDLIPIRPDGSFFADPLLDAIRTRIRNQH
ncbi:MAG: hypothetical protein R3E12_12240 [Candidatus Eisenbacteria bacterium]